MILERLSFDDVFCLEGGVLRETLVAKVNDCYPLKGKHLRPLSKHPQVLSRLSKMSVHHVAEYQLPILGELLKQCPNFRSLTLKIAGQQCLTPLVKYKNLMLHMTKLHLDCYGGDSEWLLFKLVCKQCPNLEYAALGISSHPLAELRYHLSGAWPLAKLKVTLYHEESLVWLEEICRNCSNLDLELRASEVCVRLLRSKQTLRRLKILHISNAGNSNYHSINRICERYEISLELETREGLGKLVEYPAIVGRLTKLNLSCINKEDAARLDSRETFPKLHTLEIQGLNNLQTLRNRSHIYTILSDLVVDLLNEDDALLFIEICKLSHNLQGYEVVMGFRLFDKFLRDCPMEKYISLTHDAIICGTTSRENMELLCDFEHLDHLLGQAENFRSLATLYLFFTGETDEFPALALLRRVCETAPDLWLLDIRWDSRYEPSTEFLRRLTDLSENWEIPNLNCWRFNGNVYIQRYHINHIMRP